MKSKKEMKYMLVGSTEAVVATAASSGIPRKPTASYIWALQR